MGAGRRARRTSCSQESSVMVLVMHCIILLMASVLARVKVTLLTKSHSVSSTATMRIGGRNSTLLVARSAARTTSLPGSSGVTATRSTAWKWPSAAKCNVVCGTSASGSTSRVFSDRNCKPADGVIDCSWAEVDDSHTFIAGFYRDSTHTLDGLTYIRKCEPYFFGVSCRPGETGPQCSQ